MKRELYMVDFNSEIPKGRPQLDADYWNKTNTDKQNPLTDVNTNFALKDLKDISIFKGTK